MERVRLNTWGRKQLESQKPISNTPNNSKQKNEPKQFQRHFAYYIQNAQGYSINDTLKKTLETDYIGEQKPKAVVSFLQQSRDDGRYELLTHQQLAENESLVGLSSLRELEKIDPDLPNFRYAIHCLLFPLSSHYNIDQYSQAIDDIITPDNYEKLAIEISVENIQEKIKQKIIEIAKPKDKKDLMKRSLQIFQKKYLSKIKDKQQKITTDKLKDLFLNIFDSVARRRKLDKNQEIRENYLNEFINIFETKDSTTPLHHLKTNLEVIIFLLQLSFNISDELRNQIFKRMLIWRDYEPNLQFLEKQKKNIKTKGHYNEKSFEKKEQYRLWMKEIKRNYTKSISKIKRIRKEQISKAENKTENENTEKNIKSQEEKLGIIKLTFSTIRGLENIIRNTKAENFIVNIEYQGKTYELKKLGMNKKNKKEEEKISVELDVYDFNKTIKISVNADSNEKKRNHRKNELPKCVGTSDIIIHKYISKDENNNWIKIVPSNLAESFDADIEWKIEFEGSSFLKENKHRVKQEIEEQQEINFVEIFKLIMTRMLLFANNFFGHKKKKFQEEDEDEDENKMDQMQKLNTRSLRTFKQQQKIFEFTSNQVIIPQNVDIFLTDFCLRYGISNNMRLLTHLKILVDHFQPTYNFVNDIKTILNALFDSSNENQGISTFSKQEKKEFELLLSSLFRNVSYIIKKFTFVFERNKPTNTLKELIEIFRILVEMGMTSKLDLNYISQKSQPSDPKNVFTTKLREFVEEGFSNNCQDFFRVQVESQINQEQDETQKLIEGLYNEASLEKDSEKLNVLQSKIKGLENLQKRYKEGFEPLVLSGIVTSVLRNISQIAAYFLRDTFPQDFAILDIAVNSYISELENSTLNFFKSGISNRSAEVFQLYRKMRDFNSTIQKYALEEAPRVLPIADLFLGHLQGWISETKTRFQEWISKAVELDDFEISSTENLTSTSCVDIFQMFDQSFNFLSSLEWNESNFLIILSEFFKTICDVTKEYTSKLQQRVGQMIIMLKTAKRDSHQRSSKKKVQINIQPEKKTIFLAQDSNTSLFVAINDMDFARISLNNYYNDFEEFFEKISRDDNSETIISDTENYLGESIAEMKNQLAEVTSQVVTFIVPQIHLQITEIFEKHIQNLGEENSNVKKSKNPKSSEELQKFTTEYAQTLVENLLVDLNEQLELALDKFSVSVFNQVLVDLFKFILDNFIGILIPEHFPNIFGSGNRSMAKQSKRKKMLPKITLEFPKGHISVISSSLDEIQQFFYADGDGLKKTQISFHSQKISFLLDSFSKQSNELINEVNQLISKNNNSNNSFVQAVLSRDFSSDDDFSKLKCSFMLDIIYTRGLFDKQIQKFIKNFIKNYKKKQKGKKKK
ncbi:adenylate cyclase activation protein git1 [Anaeramoeba ignava]|uniref:Adenylate cyclase activation protein git1 n=1 Tax=Anaeramoeba ignava TaxID=1746090 RepID=A0A9Q0RAV3_ANAIG|nr:adenylate cyclase activation protein git1 [Anaeramoeba ignava]